MSFSDFVAKAREQLANQGVGAAPKIGADFAFSAVSRVPLLPRLGTNVFDREWDVLLVLDACRYDMYHRDVWPCDRIWSVGSSSPEWIDHTFRDAYADEMARTAYVTANPWSQHKLSAVDFGLLDECWRYGWDDDLGTVPPRVVTDRTIAVGRRRDFDRVIAHYMQPHYPFIGSDAIDYKMSLDDFGDSDTGLALWDQFLYGIRDDVDAVWKAYERTLDAVIEHVEIVTGNVDGDVVITADHGNAVGEWWCWGHKPGMLHPKMRWVPWHEVEARDRETYQPADYDRADDAAVARLEELGYR